MRRGVVAVVGVVILVVGLAAFEPWTLWTRTTANEALPQVAATVAPSAPTPAATQSPPPKPVEVARGEFVSQEHDTSGVARVLELPNGSQVLRLEGFSTSNGPDLRVWLSDRSAGGNWFKYSGGAHVELGELKATDGNQNYKITGDIAAYMSVVIWCKRFRVSFGSAPITPA